MTPNENLTVESRDQCLDDPLTTRQLITGIRVCTIKLAFVNKRGFYHSLLQRAKACEQTAKLNYK